jgi:hypothetical protein
MDRKAATEPVHIRGWIDCDQEIVERGQGAYLADGLDQGPFSVHFGSVSARTRRVS